MPLWMIIAILKGWWQVSTDERFCFELIKPVRFHSSHHINIAEVVRYSHHSVRIRGFFGGDLEIFEQAADWEALG